MKNNHQNRPPYNKYKTASHYFLLGIEQHKLGNYIEAIKHYSSAIAADPKSVGSFNNRGIANASISQYEAAISDFNNCIALEPKHPDAHSNRALAKSKLNYPSEDIIEDCNQAININPKNVEAFSIRGTEYQNQRKFKEAILDYNQALSINPEFAEAFNNRGNAYWNLGNLKKAISDFSQALNINSQYVEAYINRGNVSIELGFRYEAIADFCMAIPPSLNLLSKKQHHVKISRLLKFREVSEHNLRGIQNRNVWFAHPDSFTDKQDGKYLLQLFPDHDSVKQVVSTMLVYSCFGLLLGNEDLHEDISVNNENIMWANYGAGGKGICLHYQYGPEKALQTTKFSFDKISYVNEINLDENISLYDTLQHGFFTKHTDFHFESECRFISVSRENDLKGQIVNEADLGLCLVAVDFGVKCSQADKQKIFDVVSARDDGKPVLFYELKNAAAGTFKFKRTRLLR